MENISSIIRIMTTKCLYRINKEYPFSQTSSQKSIDSTNNDFYSSNYFPSEEERITISIKRSMEKQRKKVDAIGSLKFTVGSQEGKDFKKENTLHKEQGQFHYQKCIELGFHEQVSLWIHMVDVDESITSCITDLTLVPRNHVSRDLIRQGYMLLASHDLLPCAFFGKRDASNDSVVSCIELSLGNKNDKYLVNTHLVVSGCLSSYYGLAKGRLWMLRLSRNEKAIFMRTLQTKDDFDEYRKNMSSRPMEKALQEFISKRTRSLFSTHTMEQNESNLDHHLIPYAVGFLCMDDADIVSMEATFRSIDRNSDGIISVSEFLKYINGPLFLERFVHKMFTLPLDSSYNVVDEQGWTFAATLNAVSVFAIFGENELLRFILSLYDDQENGKMDVKDLRDVAILLHPRRKDVMTKMVEDLVPSTSQYLTFDDLVNVNDDCPQLLYPVFDLQCKVQKAFLGIQFWERKKRKFRKALEMLEKENSSVN